MLPMDLAVGGILHQAAGQGLLFAQRPLVFQIYSVSHGCWERNEAWSVCCQAPGETWFWSNCHPGHWEFSGPKIQVVSLVLGVMLAGKV